MRDSKSKRVVVKGWKHSSDDMSICNTPCFFFFTYDAAEILMQLKACTGLTLPPNATVQMIVGSINDFILSSHVQRWNKAAERPLGYPETTPGPCAGRSCVNFAIVYPNCAECCHRLYKVDVATSTVPGAGLGLFAAKKFQAGEYVCDYTYEMTETSKVEGTKVQNEHHPDVAQARMRWKSRQMVKS